MGHLKEFLFKNGDKVREKVTGFEGTITGTAFYLTGCTSHLITGKQFDPSKEPIALWYDEGRIELIEAQFIKKESVSSKENGCDILPNIGSKGA
jgi:hypothetical protein